MKQLMFIGAACLTAALFTLGVRAQEYGSIGLWVDTYREECRARDCNENYQCSGSIFAFCKPSVDEETGWTEGVKMVDFGLRIDIPTCTGDDISVIGLPIDGQEGGPPYADTEAWVTSEDCPVEIAVRIRYGECKEADGDGWFLLAKITYTLGDIGTPLPCSIALVNPQPCVYINDPQQTVIGEHRCNPPYTFHPHYVVSHVTINQPCEDFVGRAVYNWGAIKSLYR